MSAANTLAAALPVLQPEDAGARLLLFGVRQMGAHGLHDACTAHAFVTAFGKGFQRPLVLLRALMAEMSAASIGPIQIAPWCCPRMTGPEATLLEVVAGIRKHPVRAQMLLADLLGIRDAAGIGFTVHALANAFADLALPLDEVAA
ncbi:hypothetical protein E5A73_02540 [Sphingomonas gei]|uniref:Uncharacterized protein n=1 Tax=Sphingomonas gei TaxID=1395960 RepID=A0A4S1XJM6_9SPHN|nr:DUF6628 family protein [Sphingomonas gei]TGX56010.1 hypothetical protein E5A73_02540 [Sphingomonas gei]